MKKAEKASEPKAETHEQPEADTESNVGLDEPKVQEQSSITASDIALEALVQCESNGVAIKDFMLALKEQLEMLDQTQAVA